MDRFEGAREAALKKYTMMERPQGRLAEQVEVAVDALAALTLGAQGRARARILVWLRVRRSGGGATRSALFAFRAGSLRAFASARGSQVPTTTC